MTETRSATRREVVLLSTCVDFALSNIAELEDGCGEEVEVELKSLRGKLNRYSPATAWDLIQRAREEAVDRDEYALAVWHIGDVFAQAKDMGRRLTVEEAKWVIERVDNKHDASVGIAWDVLSYWVDEVVTERRLKRKEKRRKHR